MLSDADAPFPSPGQTTASPATGFSTPQALGRGGAHAFGVRRCLSSPQQQQQQSSFLRGPDGMAGARSTRELTGLDMTPTSAPVSASMQQAYREIEQAREQARRTRLEHEADAGMAVSEAGASSPVRRPNMSTKRRSPFGLVCPLQRKTHVPALPPREEIYARTQELLRRGARFETATSASVCHQGCGGVINACAYCSNRLCGECSHVCERCQDSFCTICSVRNYDKRWERLYCLSCNAEVRKEESSSPPRDAAGHPRALAASAGAVGFSSRIHFRPHPQPRQQRTVRFDLDNPQQHMHEWPRPLGSLDLDLDAPDLEMAD